MPPPSQDDWIERLHQDLSRQDDPLGLLEALLAHMPLAVTVFDRTGHTILANRALAKLFGTVPPPEYNAFEDTVVEAQGLRDALGRAFAGETVELPVIWYDPNDLHLPSVQGARRAAVAGTLVPLRGKDGQVAYVANIFRDLTEEVQAREETERARAQVEEELRFLADASATLGQSIDLPTTLQRVADLAVPFLADWASFSLLDETGSHLDRVALASNQPELMTFAVEEIARMELTEDVRHGPVFVARTGNAELVKEITEEVLQTMQPTESRRAWLRSTRLTAYLCVPIRHAQRLLGTLLLAVNTPGRVYDEHTLLLAQQLADRAAVAVENALLHRRTEESLALLDSIYTRAPIGLGFLDRSKRYRRVNEALAALNQQTVEQHVGRAVAEVLPEEVRHVFEPLLDQALAGEELPPIEISGVMPNNPDEVGHWIVHYYPVRLGTGEVAGVGGVVLDVSAQKRAEERLRFVARASARLAEQLTFEATLKQAAELAVPQLGDGCVAWAVDDEGEARAVGRYHKDPDKLMLLDDLVRRFPRAARDPHGPSAVARSRRSEHYTYATDEDLRRTTTNAEHTELRRRLGHGSVLTVPLVARDRSFGALTFLSSRTSRPHGMEERQLAEDFAQRVALAADNARLHEHAQRTARAREDFLAIVSHDLRSPLTAMQLNAGGIDQQAGKLGVREQFQRFTQNIKNSARRMEHLMRDLLDGAAIEAGRLRVEPAPVPLGEAVQEAAEQARALAEAQGIQIAVQLAPDETPAFADRDRIVQVLQNLLANALKFTVQGQVTVSTALEGRTWSVRVEDTGTGFPPEQAAKLFDRYWQARRVGEAGAGLGLYIAKGIVEAHGGRIWAEGQPGRGAAFTFTVPAAPA